MQEDVKGFLNYLISGFDHKWLLLPCTRAFKAVCGDHSKILAPLAFDIVNKGKPVSS